MLAPAAKLMVVGLASKLNVAAVVVKSPPLIATSPVAVTSPVKVEIPSIVNVPLACMLPPLEMVTPVDPYPPPTCRESTRASAESASSTPPEITKSSFIVVTLVASPSEIVAASPPIEREVAPASKIVAVRFVL